MKTRVLLLCVLVFLVACDWPTGPQTPQQTQNVTIVIGQPTPEPSPTPSPSAAPGCQPVAEVTVSILGEADARFPPGTETLDATPRDSSGRELPRNCHGSAVVWSRSGTAPCSITGTVTSFNPQLTCTAPGSVTVTATVASPGGTGTAVFTVE